MTSIDDQLTERANPWVKAVLWCVDDDSMSVVLQFNPVTVTLSRDTAGVGSGSEKSEVGGNEDPEGNQRRNWRRFGHGGITRWFDVKKSSGVYGKLSSSGGQNDTLGMTVMFDTSESDSRLKGLGISPIFADLLPSYSKSVLDLIQPLYELTKPILMGDPNPLKAPVERPPIVVFLWDQLRFSGAITSFGAEVSAFDKVGVARRAEVRLTLTGRAFMQGKTGNEVADDTMPVKEVQYDVTNTIEFSQMKNTDIGLAMSTARKLRFT